MRYFMLLCNWSRVLRSTILGLVLASVVLLSMGGCQDAAKPTSETSALPYYNEASFTPQWYPTRASVPDDFHTIPAFMLLDQQGQTITEEDFKGKLYIANFFFTACPGICPMTMANMGRLQTAFAEDADVVLLSHSVTPEKDSVSVLQAFAERMRVLAPKWYLATGAREAIYDLGKHAYFAEEDLGELPDDPAATREEAFLHTESFFLVDQDGHLRGVYNGMNTASVTQLIADVRSLQNETAN